MANVLLTGNFVFITNASGRRGIHLPVPSPILLVSNLLTPPPLYSNFTHSAKRSIFIDFRPSFWFAFGWSKTVWALLLDGGHLGWLSLTRMSDTVSTRLQMTSMQTLTVAGYITLIQRKGRMVILYLKFLILSQNTLKLAKIPWDL